MQYYVKILNVIKQKLYYFGSYKSMQNDKNPLDYKNDD